MEWTPSFSLTGRLLSLTAEPFPPRPSQQRGPHSPPAPGRLLPPPAPLSPGPASPGVPQRIPGAALQQRGAGSPGRARCLRRPSAPPPERSGRHRRPAGIPRPGPGAPAGPPHAPAAAALPPRGSPARPGSSSSFLSAHPPSLPHALLPSLPPPSPAAGLCCRCSICPRRCRPARPAAVSGRAGAARGTGARGHEPGGAERSGSRGVGLLSRAGPGPSRGSSGRGRAPGRRGGVSPEPGQRRWRPAGRGGRPPMCDMIDSQSAEKISRMKKLRRTLSESFGRIGESWTRARRCCPYPGVPAGRAREAMGSALPGWEHP